MRVEISVPWLSPVEAPLSSSNKSLHAIWPTTLSQEGEQGRESSLGYHLLVVSSITLNCVAG